MKSIFGASLITKLVPRVLIVLSLIVVVGFTSGPFIPLTYIAIFPLIRIVFYLNGAEDHFLLDLTIPPVYLIIIILSDYVSQDVMFPLYALCTIIVYLHLGRENQEPINTSPVYLNE